MMIATPGTVDPLHVSVEAGGGGAGQRRQLGAHFDLAPRLGNTSKLYS